MTTTPAGLLLVLAVLVPILGMLAAFVLGGRNAARVALVTLATGLAVVVAIAVTAAQSNEPLVYLLGNWEPPLGVALRADKLAVVMMTAVAVVMCGIGLYAQGDFTTPADVDEARAPLVFWTMLLAIWGALNLVLVSGDLFTLYVALELMTFAAVPLVSLDGRAETAQAALRYLLFALFGSVFYLLGAVLLYGAYGTLDITLLGEQISPTPATLTAAALMTAGLLAKTALVPMHLWLPPAHAGAPAAASAVLSGIVIKGSWFLLVRLWFDVFANVVTFPAAQLLGGLGAVAIVAGNIVALRQVRLKLLIAYSTVAQIGYLFLMFPLGFAFAADTPGRDVALHSGVLQAVSHASAKAAMFMAAGSVYLALGHDRISQFAGAGRALPGCFLTFAIAGCALMALPPGGAYLAKKLLLESAAGSGQWWWAVVMQVGGLLTAGYVVLVLAHALWPAERPVTLQRPVSLPAQGAALFLALCSLGLGLWIRLLDPSAGLPSAFDSSDLLQMIILLLSGAALAFVLALQLPAALAERCQRHTATLAVRHLGTLAGRLFADADAGLRQWPLASIALISTALAFGMALVATTASN